MGPKSFPTLTDSGAVIDHSLDEALTNSLARLPYGHDGYFVTGPNTFLVPVAALVFSRARPKGIANANSLMMRAAAGDHPPRAPITVRPFANTKWQVINGNSTAINALLSGWPDIPCEPEAERGHEAEPNSA
jgi:hypothetical protein